MTRAAQTIAQQFLTFKLGDETFAVDVSQVREILDQIQITRIPQMPDYLLGVINLRGSAVPVVDLHRKFGLPACATTHESCIVVLEVDCDGVATVVGAQCDAVSEVLDLPQEAIEPPPRLWMQLKTEFIRGMGKKDESFIILLDIDRIFASDELAQLNEGCSSSHGI